MLTILLAVRCSRGAGNWGSRKSRLSWSSPNLPHSPCKVQACDGWRKTTSSPCVLAILAVQAAFIVGSYVCLLETWWHYKCCAEMPSSVCLFSDLLLPDATISCSLYLSFWLPCLLSFTFIEGVFHEVKERRLCPELWEKEKDSTNVTLRAYSSRAAVFVNGYREGVTEFGGENVNPGKNIVELWLTIPA